MDLTSLTDTEIIIHSDTCLYLVLLQLLNLNSSPLTATVSFVEQLKPAGVAVVSADLAVGLVEVGGVGERRRERVVVRGGDGVSRRRDQGLGVTLWDGEWGGAVVLIGGGRRSSPRSQGLPLRQLVS